MECPRCNQPMRVTHSYSAGRTGRTQRQVCEACGKVVTVVARIAHEDPKRGQGAAAVAKKLAEDHSGTT